MILVPSCSYRPAPSSSKVLYTLARLLCDISFFVAGRWSEKTVLMKWNSSCPFICLYVHMYRSIDGRELLAHEQTLVKLSRPRLHVRQRRIYKTQGSSRFPADVWLILHAEVAICRPLTILYPRHLVLCWVVKWKQAPIVLCFFQS